MASTDRAATGPASAPARRLQATTAAVRLSFTWLGVRRTLSRDQTEQAAEPFGAQGTLLSAAKRLFNTRHPAYRAVTSVRSRAAGYWRGVTLPFPEPGVRLIRQDRVETFDRQMTELREELDEAVKRLDAQYDALRADARERLGRLYDPRDYPPTLVGLFGLDWEFPSVEPPGYLMQLNPQLFEQERARVQARFEEAVTLAEEAFTAELSKLIEHLTERVSGTDDGKPKVFRDTAVTNLREFFQRFGQLNVRSNPELDALVERARAVVSGVDPQDLRDAAGLRQRVRQQLSTVSRALDELLVERPRRRVLRPLATPAEQVA